MKKLIVTICFCCAAAMAFAGHHLNGTWKMNVAIGGQQGGTATFVLTEGEGGTLSGTYSGALGTENIKGTVKGSEIEFSFDSQAGKISYKGTVSGTTIKGSCSYGQLGAGTFEGEKSAAE